MPESVLADLLAHGAFDSVAATAEGPPLAFASQAGFGANAGQAWDPATGLALGPPVPDFPAERAEWAFGAPAGSPVVAWTHRDRVHVHHLETGHELSLDGQPELVGLAVHTGRGAVVAVFGPANDAEVVVWDALTGDRLTEFPLWLGHQTAIDRWILHATPSTGPLVGLPGDSAVTVLDVERGDEITTLPAHAVLAPSPDGLVLVQPAPSALHVRGLDGDRLADLAAPSPCDQIAAALTGGRLLVTAALRDDPGTVLAWDTATSEPSHRIKVPAPVNDLALTPDGTLLTATDEGLYTTRLCG
ncbi:MULTISPECIES: WD40 repeat domain-containing protein [unclassified Spirillospora]|uniref:WD40 repeat domain-containing protein n=1 Tax=unclassified Spirillospora TaxID=2642701 RepID=UPI00371166B0